MDPLALQALLNQQDMGSKAEIRQLEQSSRLQALNELGRQAGMQAGMQHYISQLQAGIKARERQLDAAYPFSSLMVGSIVPPVIVEAHDVFNQPDSATISLATAQYVIVKQAHLSSRPPNWRAYLELPQSTVDAPNLVGFKPQGQQEKQVWQSAVRDGWKNGEQAATAVVQHAFNDLNRDFEGMIRYHELAMRGWLRLPEIDTHTQASEVNPDQVTLNSQTIRLTVLPVFKPTSFGPVMHSVSSGQ